MKDELIIVNHIGTSNVDAIDNELKWIVKEIENEKNCEVALAFNSQYVINKLQKKNVQIKHVKDLLLEAVGNYYIIKILPIHLVEGIDYQRLKDVCERIYDNLYTRNTCSKIILIEFLLKDKKNVQSMTKIISDIVKEKDMHILFVGHGSLHDSEIYYRNFIDSYREINNRVSFMTLKTPISSILNEIPDEVVLFPLFTVSGHHMQKDIFEGEESIYNQLKKFGKKIHAYLKISFYITKILYVLISIIVNASSLKLVCL
ncbi:sirohydrochlorin cobaltochelatase [Defluviitalea phaphyphila]|uniref:sirohydrochlorin cobaltochelatase n=1 Tax=Defluviitalea phaphyphila TaxID=1473580 RepID=UPI000730100D|nr:sirohydrochlorin cobaltochelatase [Defluviitalea phaphyphila]